MQDSLKVGGQILFRGLILVSPVDFNFGIEYFPPIERLDCRLRGSHFMIFNLEAHILVSIKLPL